MQVFYDLHIHSALSPCADDDMTPNNIVGMASLKGLHAIAVCDHNCTDNLPAFERVAGEHGITFIPGVEINTVEEVHLLALFYDMENALACGKLVYDSLPDIKNNPEFFGRQLVMDAHDNIIGEQEKLLISASGYSLDECCDLVKEHGGIYIPAHVNKQANSIMANLGFFPPHLHFPAIELWQGEPVQEFPESSRLLHNSDAHTLGQISEPENFLEASSQKRKEILNLLQSAQ